jgi:protein PsiE
MANNDESEKSADSTDGMNHLEGPDAGTLEKSLALGAFHWIERGLLLVVVLMTLGGAAFEIHTVYLARTINLADILLIFLYLEIVGMVAVYYSDRRSVFVYPIFIAITALARLIILQGKDMAPENILFEAISVLILAIAATVIVNIRQN